MSEFHDPMETDAFIALAEPNHRLTLSQGTNLAIATSLRIIFPTLCILILHCFWRRKKLKKLRNTEKLYYYINLRREMKFRSKTNIFKNFITRYKVLKYLYLSIQSYLHVSSITRNGYWSLRFWIESSNKYPAGHESAISKLSRLVWDINFLSHSIHVSKKREMSLWSIENFYFIRQ